GLLLPQVAVEEKMSAIEFLNSACWKAGMKPECWTDPETSIYTFGAEIFYEVEPRGAVFRKILKQEK
ncbi:MAG: AMMECR1 domain-containing protein, partial [Thermoplasmatales archaeon]